MDGNYTTYWSIPLHNFRYYTQVRYDFRVSHHANSFILTFTYIKSRDSSVSIALGYRLDDPGSRVRFPAGAGNFSPHHRYVQNGFGAHPASYPMGTRGSFLGGKAAGA
jgi:hypothetical protein